MPTVIAEVPLLALALFTGTPIVPVASASAGLRYFVRHNVDDVVQCFAGSNVRFRFNPFLDMPHGDFPVSIIHGHR
jgi:hypothetical protein